MRVLEAKASDVGGQVTVGFNRDDIKLLTAKIVPDCDIEAKTELQKQLLDRLRDALKAIRL